MHDLWGFFYSPHCTANCVICVLMRQKGSCVQITCKTFVAYHVQHVMCHVVGRDSSSIFSSD